jgi:predicted nucleic acid-binding protein
VAALGKMLKMRRLTLLQIDDDLARRSAGLAADLRLRGADAVYVSVADRLNLPLVTWDSEQLNRGSLAIEVRSPDQLLPNDGDDQL